MQRVISLAVLARFLKRNGCIYCENGSYSERVDEEELQMRISAALVTTSTLPLSLTQLVPSFTRRCRVACLSTPITPDSRSRGDDAHKLFTLTTLEFPSRRRGSCRITL